MKRALLYGMMLLWACVAAAQGIPFIKNYTPDDYHAHNRNFDVITTDDGSVFIANFEGLLYYNNVEWRMIHTPGITRVTVIYKDKNNDIWAGGYNYFGKIQRNNNGELYLQTIGKQGAFRGEVQEIWEEDKDHSLNFFVNDGNIYEVKDNQFHIKKQISKERLGIGLSDVVDIDKLEETGKAEVLSDVTQREPLGNGLVAVVKRGQGLVITDNNGKELYTITETNGLCTNSVVYIAYDGHGRLWGSTENGIFSIAIPSAFSCFTRNEGLCEEVLSIAEFNGKKYVGTIDGLFCQEGKRFVNIGLGNHACWQLTVTSQGLMAATSNGIYCLTANGAIRQLSSMASNSFLDLGTEILSGEIDGVYAINKATNARNMVCKLEKVTKIIKDQKGVIWLQNIYGEVWCKQSNDKEFHSYHSKTNDAATIVPIMNSIMVVGAEAEKPFPYPLFSYLDHTGITWLTNSEGKSLYRWKDGKDLDDLKYLLRPIEKVTIRAMFVQDNEVWLGNDAGFTIINTKENDPALNTKPKLLIRTIKLRNDSVLWGGYGEMPTSFLLKSKENHLTFTYSLDFETVIGENLYRYQLNDGNWSAWADDKDVEFTNLPYGSYTLKIQGRDGFGHETEVVSFNFAISYPFYLKWYMICLYILLFGACIYGLVQLRLRQLEKDKQQLEKVVQERTAEVVKQKDEIQEKSESLEKALDDLHSAQNQLIRQEKMATVGKLTQGLIDRILNPLNYINNFSKLSQGLVKDIEANIEDEKDHMDEENYEDTIDVLGMLDGNLQKVGEHGVNTTRTLKAMEEMLKDRTGGVVEMDLTSVFKQDEEMVGKYYAEEIKQYHIATKFNYPDSGVLVKGNPDQLSKTFMSMIGNAIYAIVKKAQRKPYEAVLSLEATVADGMVNIVIRDNGIGIEEKIIDKIFDPFFTTKTTGEASGIGLYLSHDVIQNYGGNISVESVKDEYTQFTITLPVITQ